MHSAKSGTSKKLSRRGSRIAPARQAQRTPADSNVRRASRPRADRPQPSRRIRPGSAAEEEQIREHLPLVKVISNRLALNLPAHVDADDLFSFGMVGLLNAVRNFDPEGGSSFESYAKVRIRGAMLDELRRLDWVPRSIHDKSRKVQVAMQKLEQLNGAAPNDQEMATALEISVEDYQEMKVEIRPPTLICLNAPITSEEDGDIPCEEIIADDRQPDPVDCVARREMADRIAEAIAELPTMQRKVLALYYYEDFRLREIAEAFGITESRVCQIHSQAIQAIRRRLHPEELAAFATRN